MLPQIYIIRHGETDWSLSGQHTSTTDLPLTARGEVEAREVTERLGNLKFDSVVSSPRLRARATAAVVAPAVVPTIDAGLVEWDYGDYEGLTTAQIQALRPGWSLFEHGAPGGESPLQVEARVARVLTRLTHETTGTLALFTHGHFARALAARFLGLPLSAARYFALSTASISILGYEHESRQEPVLRRWNA